MSERSSNRLRAIEAGTCALIALLAAGCRTPVPPPASAPPPPPLLAAPSPAAPAPSSTGLLTLDAAIARALAASEEVSVLRAAVDVAFEQKRAASDIPDPEFRLAYADSSVDNTRRRYTEEGPLGVTERQNGTTTDDGTSARAGLRFFPPNPWVLPARLSASDAAVNVARAELANAEWATALTVRRLVAEVLYLGKDVAVLDNLADQSRQVYESMKERSQQADATMSDVMTASRRHLQALSARDRGRRRLGAQKRLLASLLDMDAEWLDIEPEAAVLVVSNHVGMAASELEQTALRNRADLAAVYWKSAQSQALYRQARAEGIPWFKMIEGSVSRSSETSTGADSSSRLASSPLSTTHIDDSSDGTDWQIAAAINIPMFSWMNRDDDVRQAELNMARIREAQAVKTLRRQIRNAVEQLGDVQTQWSYYRQETEPLVQQMQKTLESLQHEAQLTPAEAADIRTQILEAQRSRLLATYEFTMAVIDFEEVLGTRISSGRKRPSAAP